MRALAACAVTALAFSAAPAVGESPPPDVNRLSPLQVVRSAPGDGGDARIVDADGRQVLLRGINVNQLNDYYRGHPDLPTTIPLTEQDFADIAALGFDSVRLTFNWSSLEPRRDEIDANELERLRQAVGWAADHGLYVVLDMHQDAWGKHVATAPDEQCLPGFDPAIGWDGAPAWATHLDGVPTCRFQARELSAAVAQAFTSFWLDRDGIQSEVVELWGLLASTFADEPAVAGYDLLNEPHPGWSPGATDLTALGVFYERAIDAIRRAESDVAGGFHHIVFFEPMITRAITRIPSPLPGFTADPQIVYAPHNYAESIEVLPAGNPTIEENFAADARAAELHGTTFWVGEWGFFGNPAAQRDLVRRFARQEDQHLVGGAWWVWKQACGDPHVVGTPGNTPTGISPSLVRIDCPSGDELGIPPPFAEVLSRTYPRAAPGRLLELASDPATGRAVISGDAGASGPGTLDLWVPRRDGRPPPTVDGSNVGRVVSRPVDGGFRVLASVRGHYEVRVSFER